MFLTFGSIIFAYSVKNKTKIIIKFIETGLQEDEVLFYGHKVYIPENTVLKIERSKDGQQTTFRNERRNR